jgi:hypothetical protein
MSTLSETLIPPINVDVIATILEHLESDVQSTESPEFGVRREFGWRETGFLASLCLVCRDWLIPARKTLYRVIPFRNDDSSTLFASTMLHYPELRHYIHRLYICTGLLLDIIPLLPRCAVTCIPFNVNTPLPDTLLTTTPLSVLYLRNFAYSTKQWMVAFKHWINLQELGIIFYTPNLPLHYGDLEDQYHLRSLRILKLKNLSYGRVLCLPTTSNTLHTLVLDRCIINVSSLLDFLSHHSTSLRRVALTKLRLWKEGDDNEEGLSDMVLRLPLVERLCIQDIRGLLSTTPSCDALFISFPPTLIHLWLKLTNVLPSAPLSYLTLLHHQASSSEVKLKYIELLIDPDNSFNSSLSEWKPVWDAAESLGTDFWFRRDRIGWIIGSLQGEVDDSWFSYWPLY